MATFEGVINQSSRLIGLATETDKWWFQPEYIAQALDKPSTYNPLISAYDYSC